MISNEHMLPSSLGPDNCMVYIAGPRMRGLLAFSFENIVNNNARIRVSAETQGITDYATIRQNILNGLHYILVRDEGEPDKAAELQQAACMVVWLVWNEPTTTEMLPNLRWLTFGSTQIACALHTGSDDAEFEARRTEITELLDGHPMVKH